MDFYHCINKRIDALIRYPRVDKVQYGVRYSSGSMSDSHAKDPGLIPGCSVDIFTLPDGSTSVIVTSSDKG